MIKFSSATTNLIFDAQEFTGRNVRHISHISMLIEISYTAGNNSLFNDLIFKAKYLKGLKNISLMDISGNNIDTKSSNEKITKEMSSELTNLKNLIHKIISNLSTEEKADFENNFFKLDKDCLLKYYELIEDLSMFKEYFNSKS